MFGNACCKTEIQERRCATSCQLLLPQDIDQEPKKPISWAGESPVAEYLPSLYKSLGSILSTTRKYIYIKNTWTSLITKHI